MSYDLDVRSDPEYSKAAPLSEVSAIVGALPGITRVTPTFYVLDHQADGIHVNIELANESGRAARSPDDPINSVGLLVPYPMLERSGPLALEMAFAIAEKCGWSVYDPQTDCDVTRATVREALESQKLSGESARDVLARVASEEGRGPAVPALGELFNRELWNHSFWVMVASFVIAATAATWFMVVRGWPSEDFGRYLPWMIAIGGVSLLWIKALAVAYLERRRLKNK